MNVPNKLFYNDIKNDPKQRFSFFIHKDKPLLFVNVESQDNFIDPSYDNQEEAEVIRNIIDVLINDYGYPKEWFGILTPYSG